MSEFEYIYPSEQNREEDPQREINLTIELSDKDHLSKLRPYPLFIEHCIEKDTKVVNLKEKNEKSKSKIPKKKSKKDHNRANKTAVESLQKKL